MDDVEVITDYNKIGARFDVDADADVDLDAGVDVDENLDIYFDAGIDVDFYTDIGIDSKFDNDSQTIRITTTPALNVNDTCTQCNVKDDFLSGNKNKIKNSKLRGEKKISISKNVEKQREIMYFHGKDIHSKKFQKRINRKSNISLTYAILINSIIILGIIMVIWMLAILKI
jgi:hypothetical protein